ncbi:hypothetical protein AN958_07272 [Leucoagaricus sp. SymC.cos]|nr:hypothetical protein AN958_07272 [Leucoagaricus sp. SymC.cos]
MDNIAEENRMIPHAADETRHVGPRDLGAPAVSSGFFNKAQNLVVHNPIMVDNSTTTIQNMISNGKTVLEHLAPYAEPRAELYSNARHPPPSCHEGTRARTRKRLWDWFNDVERDQRRERQSLPSQSNSERLTDDVRGDLTMKWLRGSAGTGKSAVAQTFAEECAKESPSRLGAVFFFSRANGFNDHTRVIPTLAYQLAVNCLPYKLALTEQLVSDPQLLEKAPPTLFKKLVVDPFLKVQAENRQPVQQPYLILLDGLDECHGEDHQCELVEMIAEAARTYNVSLPLRWLIISRPEEHLKYVFADVQLECSVEELLIDGQCREDVRRFLRDGFAQIRKKCRNRIPQGWPPMDEFKVVEKMVDGLFVFGSTILKDIGNRTYDDPVHRLTTLVSFLKDVKVTGIANPLEVLDKFYTCICDNISEAQFSTTWRILAHLIYMPGGYGDVFSPENSAQGLCNFLHIDQSTFYGSLRKLHSVINIPEPEDAGKSPLRFFHTSFRDFLTDSNRSGRYHIGETKAITEVIKSMLFWCEIDATHFHSHHGTVRFVNDIYYNGPLPNLKWVSAQNEKRISYSIIRYSTSGTRPWWLFRRLASDNLDDFGLLLRMKDFDFRYIAIEDEFDFFKTFIAWLCKQDHLNEVIRTEPTDEIDHHLLSYLDILLEGRSKRPASLSTVVYDWSLGGLERPFEYLFLGKGPKAIIMCKGFKYSADLIGLNANEPSGAPLLHLRYRLSLMDHRPIIPPSPTLTDGEGDLFN